MYICKVIYGQKVLENPSSCFAVVCQDATISSNRKLDKSELESLGCLQLTDWVLDQRGFDGQCAVLVEPQLDDNSGNNSEHPA